MEWFLQIFLPIFITQLMIIIPTIINVVGRHLENKPEWKRIKQQIEDKKKQLETHKQAVNNVCVSKLAWSLKQPLFEFYKEEMLKLKDEIIRLNNQLPEKQRESIKLNVSELISVIEKIKKGKE